MVRILGGRLRLPGEDIFSKVCELLNDMNEGNNECAQVAYIENLSLEEVKKERRRKAVAEKERIQEEDRQLRNEFKQWSEKKRRQRLGRDRVDIKQYHQNQGML
ncbi:hypothetical protein BT69DRAFT_1283393 [Atractiella rhizophila]|nr:hypothetical protein BT69DRAFT_1283393 [Atractiella rhizophila]